VRHILIILSILLISSPLFSQETGVLYLYETSSGKKWETFGDGKVQPKYTGEIKNGKMDGLGVLTYPYGEKSVVGEWKNGKEWNTKHTKHLRKSFSSICPVSLIKVLIQSYRKR